MAAIRTGRPYLHEAELDLVADRLVHAARCLEDLAIESAEAHAIAASQWRVMSALAPCSSLALGDLRSKLNVTKQSLHGVVESLLTRDIIIKHGDAADGRRKSLRLSTGGSVLHATIAAGARLRLARCLREFGPEQAGIFRRILNLLTEAP